MALVHQEHEVAVREVFRDVALGDKFGRSIVDAGKVADGAIRTNHLFRRSGTANAKIRAIGSRESDAE